MPPVDLALSFVQLSEHLEMVPGLVGVVAYDCRERLGIAPEIDPIEFYDPGIAGSLEGYWTGEIDTWGMLTIRPVDGREPLYLFPDEIVKVDY